jgi:hypothetical protein
MAKESTRDEVQSGRQEMNWMTVVWVGLALTGGSDVGPPRFSDPRDLLVPCIQESWHDPKGEGHTIAMDPFLIDYVVRIQTTGETVILRGDRMRCIWINAQGNIHGGEEDFRGHWSIVGWAWGRRTWFVTGLEEVHPGDSFSFWWDDVHLIRIEVGEPDEMGFKWEVPPQVRDRLPDMEK